MARGGARPGAGRKKDPKNVLIKAMTSAIKGGTVPPVISPVPPPPTTDEMPDMDLQPLEYLLNIVRNPQKPEDARMRAAALALPFCHAKPGEKGKKEEKRDAAASAASGKFGTPQPPRLKAVS